MLFLCYLLLFYSKVAIVQFLRCTSNIIPLILEIRLYPFDFCPKNLFGQFDNFM